MRATATTTTKLRTRVYSELVLQRLRRVALHQGLCGLRLDLHLLPEHHPLPGWGRLLLLQLDHHDPGDSELPILLQRTRHEPRQPGDDLLHVLLLHTGLLLDRGTSPVS